MQALKEVKQLQVLTSYKTYKTQKWPSEQDVAYI